MKKLIFLISGLSLLVACKFNNVTKILPIYGTRKPITKTVNGQQETDTVYATITPFRFISQYGDSSGSKELEGKIYVADFFFTSCPSICPGMQRNMLTVYKAYK